MPAIPSEEEWLEQTARAREEAEQLQATEQWPSDAPVHPIAQLQGPFEESIAESTDVTHDDWQVYLDAETRRDHILTAPKYERLCGRRWKQRPGEKYHPMWKLVAQLSFGLHLLAKGLAKSDAAVIKILQGHVADLDGFIENTTEDILLALNDIEERLDHLRLPLENLPVFNDMLTDRTFRQTVILDHGRINHIIHRTAVALDDSIKDIEKGTQSVRILGFYLKEVRAECNGQSYGLDAVYDAMIGNVDGWKREFKRLKRKAYNLAISLGTLNQVALEIQQLAEAATVNSMRNMASTRPPSRGHRHGEHTLLTPDTHTLAAIPHRPPPQSLTEPVSYTAEARAVSIVSGHSPVTVVNTASSRQESPALQRDGTPPKQALHEKHPSRTGKESSSHANRYYTNAQPNLAKLPRRSVTAPELKINNNNKYGGNEQGSKKRSNTSSSKAADHYVVPEKGSTKTSAKLGSKLDRFQRTTSKILGISALTNVKGTIRKQTKPKVSQRVTIPPKERSWVDPNSHDQQMSWSQVSKDLSDINTFAAKKSTAPELPHLLYKSFLDQTLSDEEEEDTEDSPKKELDDEHDHESQITALPVMKDSAAASYNDDGVAAEVASTYSVRNRRFRTKNIHVTPLSKPKFNNSFELGANNGHVIHQDRQTARQKPSVFSFMSSKKGQETAPNPPVVRSRQGSVTSENRRRRPMTSPSASTSAHLYGDIQPPPTFNPTWHTHKRSPLANTETPPISPTTSSNPMASSSSPKTSEIKAPQISQPESHKSIPNTNPRKVPTEKPPTLDINQKEIKKSDTLRGNENNKLRNDASSTTTTTTTTQKPQHGGLRLFPRTPTTPNVRKFVSTSSLREFSAAESTSDSAHLPRSRG